MIIYITSTFNQLLNMLKLTLVNALVTCFSLEYFGFVLRPLFSSYFWMLRRFVVGRRGRFGAIRR